MSKPLAYIVRPKTLDDIVGQNKLVGKNGIIRKMIEQNKLSSIILYGPPGCGKTTIAKVIKSYYEDITFEFNASSENKQILKDITEKVRYYGDAILIIDEIHRMKKDVQDYLLPFIENGSITVIGLTTANPYIAINPALRSRCRPYQMESISIEDIVKYLRKLSKNEMFKDLEIDDDILNYIAKRSGCEIRTAINMLESLNLLKGKITVDDIKDLIGMTSLRLDSKDINYYDLLSALQKSIRGSDVDASLYYLAKLIKLEDLEIIIRRLRVIAYEDIGLANPQVGPRVYAALNTAKELGFPEARIPLAYAVIDLALSPKSNSAEAAIDNALKDVLESGEQEIPRNILNREIKGDSSLYKYPHDYPNDIVYQEYMPKNIRDHTYYFAKETGKYEAALKKYNEEVKKILKK